VGVVERQINSILEKAAAKAAELLKAVMETTATEIKMATTTMAESTTQMSP